MTTTFETSHPLETSMVRQIGDATSDANESGATFASLPQEPAWELGTLLDAQVDVSASAGSGSSCETTSITCNGTAIMSRVPSAGGVSAVGGAARGPVLTRIDATHLRVTETFDAAPVTIRRGSPIGARGSRDVGGAPSGAGAGAIHHERLYEKKGDEWVLAHVRNEGQLDQPNGNVRYVQAIHLAAVTIHHNREEDAKRRVRREAREQAGDTLGPVHGASHMVACDDGSGGYSGGESAILPCGDGGGGGSSGGSSYPVVAPVNEDAMVQSDATLAPGGTGPSLVLQHGFASSSDTWRPMQEWLNYSMGVNSIVRKSLDWKDLYENQAAALHQRLRTEEYLNGPVILIGHSNGGMISRYLGRHPAAYNELGTPYAYDPINVQGVVTVATPHKGAPLARSAGTLNNIIGWGGWPAKLVCPFFGLAGCYRFGQLAGSGSTTT